MADPEIKAAGQNSILAVVKRRLGAAAFADLTARLGPVARGLAERPPLPMTWVPQAIAAEIEEAIARAFGDDLEVVADIGREQMREDLGGIYRIFVRLASPQYVAGRAAAIYGTYARNAGAMTKTGEGERFAELTLAGVPRPTPVFYAFRRGNILGAIQASGVKEARCEITRGGGREPFAVYRGSWR